MKEVRIMFEIGCELRKHDVIVKMQPEKEHENRDFYVISRLEFRNCPKIWRTPRKEIIYNLFFVIVKVAHFVDLSTLGSRSV